MKTLNITITSDFICPWCWIGEEQLSRAMQASGATEHCRITFTPYLLNPNMPTRGMNRQQYRSAKFGSWARSQAMDAQVTQAGKSCGLTFNYDIVEKTPNTMAAHRLVWRQQSNGGDATDLVRAIFKAYFGEGQDIGDIEVLADIAARFGHDRHATLAFLSSDEGVADILQQVAENHKAGIHSVPNVSINGAVMSGAQPVEVFAHALKQARQA
jgi:predicted DsbA family dithiol-disulfide isomerase